MNSKTRIKKLTIEGFRGAKKKACLDLEDENKNVVLFGNNGDGKTTFSDAIEWFFTDRIDYLSREGCGREDYFNRYIGQDSNGIVEIKFSNPILDCKKTLRRQGGLAFSNASNEFSRYIRDSSKDSLILRYHTMREFIDKTKKQKLERLEEIIGFGIVGEIRDVLLKTLNSLKDDTELASLSGQLNERKRDLVAAIGKDKFKDSDILDYGSRLIRECDSTLSITNESDFEFIVETLEKRVASSDKGKQLLILDGINKSILKLVEIRDTLVEVDNIVQSHNELAKERDTIEASATEKLYRAAIEAIESKSVRAGQCPLCKRPTDTDMLLQSLKSEIEQLTEVLKKRRGIIQNAKSLCEKTTSHKIDLESLLELEEEIKKTLFTTKMEATITNISTMLSQYEEVLNKIQQYPQPVSVSPLSGLENLEEEVKESQQKVTQRKERVSETEEEKKFYGNVIKLSNLLSDYKRYKELIVQIGAFLKQIDSVEKIHESFEKMERENIRKVLKAISSDVNDFFVFLHPDDDIDEVELIPTEERGIEFKLRRHGEEISPPLKILSEAHLNSLGICLFLASAKYFNKENGFLVLDDVVTSFDTGHRRPLARLMGEKFADAQFLLFTHDELWFDILKKDLPAGKWVFKELTKWTKDEGLNIKESPITLKERISDNLDENDIKGAANKCRTLIEEILKERCQDLGVRGLEFRTGAENDRREPSELMSALTDYLKGNQTLRGKDSKKSFDHLRASQLITNIGSHHQNLTSTSLGRGDIETVLRDINEFEALFLCTECRTAPSKKYSPQFSKLKNCKCGEFKL